MENAVVHVLDDDAPLREAMARLFRSANVTAQFYGSVPDLLSQPQLDRHGCIVIDVRLPGVNGLDLQAQLGKMGILLPTIIITGYGDIPMSVRAMKAGAIDFLPKPFKDQEILDAVAAALRHDRERRESAAAAEALQDRLNQLSKRQRQVFALVVSGQSNKEIALELGISEVTIKIHRAAVMQKMGTRSLADLVRMAQALQI